MTCSMDRCRNYLFCFIGFNSALSLFRDFFPIIKLLYTLAMFLLAFFSIIALVNKEKVGSLWFGAKVFIYLFAVILSMRYGDEFFIKEVSGSMSLLLIFLIFLRKPTSLDFKYFIDGFKISLIIDYFYALVQLIILLVFKININNYLLFYVASLSMDYNLGTRVSGLCWDPYILGMFCAIGFFIFNNKKLRLLILTLLYFTFSRSGQVAFIAGFAVYFYSKYKKKINNKNIVILCSIFLILPFFIPKVIELLDFNRGFNKNSVGWRRIEYIICIPEIWMKDNNPLYILFGCAPYYSGARFFYSGLDCMTNRCEFSPYWLIETDFTAIILGRGIVGFLFHLLFYINILLKQKNLLFKIICTCIFVGGIGYNYDMAIYINFFICFILNTVELPAKEDSKLLLGRGKKIGYICNFS